MKVMTPTTTWLYVLRAPTVAAAAMWPVGLWANKRKREGSILVATDGRTEGRVPTQPRVGGRGAVERIV